MELKRLRPVSLDQVRITREGETAVIEYADPSAQVVSLQVGPSLAAMTDAQVLKLFNDMLEAQAEIAAGVDPTLIEIPPDLPQIEYKELGVASGCRAAKCCAAKSSTMRTRARSFRSTTWS